MHSDPQIFGAPASSCKSKSAHPVTKLALSSQSTESNPFDMPPLEAGSRVQILECLELLRSPIRASRLTPELDLRWGRRVRVVTSSTCRHWRRAVAFRSSDPRSSCELQHCKSVHPGTRLALSSNNNDSNPFNMPPLEAGSCI